MSKKTGVGLTCCIFFLILFFNFFCNEKQDIIYLDNYESVLKSKPAPGGNCCRTNSCDISAPNCGPNKCDVEDWLLGIWRCLSPQTFYCRGNGFGYCFHGHCGCMPALCRCSLGMCFCTIQPETPPGPIN